MYKISNFIEGNSNISVIDSKGPFSVIQYDKDLSVQPVNAQIEYFSSKMNVRKRQLVCNVEQNSGGITLQRGAMQWIAGNVNATTGIKGVGDFIGKLAKGAVSKESAIKPEYVGNGIIVTEPTYKHLILLDLAQWNESVVLEDRLFFACQSSLKQTIAMRSNLSSTLAGNEGLFNLCLKGNGIACIESECPKEELVIVDLQDDVLKIDGSFAICWSNSLAFTVERSGKSLIGSAASSEGLVNVYRGSGRVLLRPVP